MIDPARSFGRVAADYERGRPEWPCAALDLVERELGLTPATAVLDLGAGTGKLTRLLVPRFARVFAVEPDAAMRALIPAGAEVLAGTAERIPLPDASVSVVFCGECFHWFDRPRALAEIERVLEREGALVLMWNRPSDGHHSAEWPQPVSDALDALPDPSPPERRYDSLAWKDDLAESSFADLRFAVVPNSGPVSRDVLIAWIGSWSQVASLPDAERQAFLDRVAADLPEPTYRKTADTHVYWSRLAG